MNEDSIQVRLWGPWLATIAVSLSIIALVGGLTYTFVQSRENRERIAENAETAQALCDAAAGARDFWISVRESTITLLTDKSLSPIERASNEAFKRALDRVIAAADGLARSCDEAEKT